MRTPTKPETASAPETRTLRRTSRTTCSTLPAEKPTAKHSPLPWSYSDIGGDNLIMMRPKFGSERVAVAEVLYDEATERISIEEMDANKAFIVQCVNHAEALAEALRGVQWKIQAYGSHWEPSQSEREAIGKALAAWEGAK